MYYHIFNTVFDIYLYIINVPSPPFKKNRNIWNDGTIKQPPQLNIVCLKLSWTNYIPFLYLTFYVSFDLNTQGDVVVFVHWSIRSIGGFLQSDAYAHHGGIGREAFYTSSSGTLQYCMIFNMLF
jgi:hypothetical protein